MTSNILTLYADIFVQILNKKNEEKKNEMQCNEEICTFVADMFSWNPHVKSILHVCIILKKNVKL